jgi:hypothetical protein
MLLDAAVSYYFACEHADDTFTYMRFRVVDLDRILEPLGLFLAVQVATDAASPRSDL